MPDLKSVLKNCKIRINSRISPSCISRNRMKKDVKVKQNLISI